MKETNRFINKNLLGSTVAFAGLSKNAGKTVAMLYALEEASQLGMVVGLLSIGRDGEDKDVVYETHKPLIFAPEGTWIVSTEGLWSRGTAVVSIEKNLDYTTPMGDVLIGKVVREGTVEIAGPQSISQLIAARDKLFELGADIVFVDGALDRTSLAVPDLANYFVLSTGAAVSSNIDKVVEETVNRVKFLRLEKSTRYLEDIEKVIKKDCLGKIDSGRLFIYDLDTALGQDKFIREILTDDTQMLIFPGAITEGMLSSIAGGVNRNIEIVARDGTKFFLSKKIYDILTMKGFTFSVARPLNLIAVTINPSSPGGIFFPIDVFFEKMGKALPNTRIVNAMSGEMYVHR